MRKILLIALVILFSTGCSLPKNNEEKYSECISACNEEKTCLEKKVSDDGYQSAFNNNCIRWSDAECKNNCIQKYK